MFREMRRHAQQLDRNTCVSILKNEPRGVLSVLGDGGYPYGVPMNFVYADDALWFHCAREGHKLDAIGTYDKASFCVIDQGVRHEGEWWLCFNSVIAFGRVTRIDDEQAVHKALARIADKYFPTDYDTQTDIRRNLGRVAILRLDIEHLAGKAVREK